MPISFIVFIIAILFLIFYKQVKPFAISKLFLGTLLALICIGFFINSIDIAETFSVNVIFAFCVLALGMEIFFKVSNKTKAMVLFFVLLNSGLYYLLTNFNNDYLTYLNYIPAMIIVTATSLLFIKNLNAGTSLIMFSYLLIEWLNYFNFQNNIGYLNICSFEFLNALVISFLIYLSVYLIVKLTIKYKVNKFKRGTI